MTTAARKNRRKFFSPLRIFGLLMIGMFIASVALALTAQATTYVITDGERVVTYTTFATNPSEVLSQAGLSLNESDTYTTQPGEGVEEITVRRSQNILVRYHGEESVVTTFGETVGELLSRLNLEVGEYDVLSHSLQSQTFDQMELSVDQVISTQETYTAVEPYETIVCNDAALAQGATQVLTQGVDGEVIRTAEVTYVNGLETQRKVISEKVTRASVTEIIAQGTAAEEGAEENAMPVISESTITLPTGEVLTYSHTAQIRATAYTHTDAGCDMITATGTTVHIGTVAVDPRYIPYGTRMFIISNDGEYVYGISVAEDCGGDIKGDRMDLYFPTYNECIQFGRRNCTIYFLD